MRKRLEDLVAYLEDWSDRRGEDSLYSFLDSNGETVEHYTIRRFHERSNYVAVQLANAGAVRYGEPVVLVYGAAA